MVNFSSLIFHPQFHVFYQDIQHELGFMNYRVHTEVHQRLDTCIFQGSCWILSIKFQEYSRSFQEPEIEFSRSLYKNISMPYIVFQCFLC